MPSFPKQQINSRQATCFFFLLPFNSTIFLHLHWGLLSFKDLLWLDVLVHCNYSLLSPSVSHFRTLAMLKKKLQRLRAHGSCFRDTTKEVTYFQLILLLEWSENNSNFFPHNNRLAILVNKFKFQPLGAVLAQSSNRQTLNGSNIVAWVEHFFLSLPFWSLLSLFLLSHKSTIGLITLNKSSYNSLLTIFESLNPLLPLFNATCRLYLTPVDKLLGHSLSPCLKSNSLIFTLLRYY